MNKSDNKFQQTLIILLAATVGFLLALLLSDHSELLHTLVNINIAELAIRGVFIAFACLLITICLAPIIAVLALAFFYDKKPSAPKESEAVQEDASFKDSKVCRASEDRYG